MSVEDLKKFGQLCNDDLEVRNRAKAIGLYDVEGLIAYGRELGLEFTTEDMLEAAKEAGVNADELSEEDLEKIAGGVVTTTLSVIGAAGFALGAAVVGAGFALLVGNVVGGFLIAGGMVAGTLAARKW